MPPAVFGAERSPRPTPYILTGKQIQQLVAAASQSRYRICGATYRTLFSLLTCTGLRVSEAIQLRFDDLTPDGLVIRRTKFRKSRLVPLHETAQAGLERYLQQRRPYAPFDDHVFVSVRRKPLSATGRGQGIPHSREASGAAARTWGRQAHAPFLAPRLRRKSPANLPGWSRCPPMPTECSRDLFGFAPVEGREVVAAFDGGAITSDAGALLLGATDRAIGMMERFAACFHDERNQNLIEHEVVTLVGQRVFEKSRSAMKTSMIMTNYAMIR